MECPVCLTKKGSKYIFNLECNHKLCIPCAIKWLEMDHQPMTCPLCRNETKIFEKHTRSDLKTFIICRDATLTFNCYKEIYNYKIPLDVFTKYLDYFFIKYKQLWFRPRPTTRPFLNEIKQICIDGILYFNNIIDWYKNYNADQYAQLYYYEYQKELLLKFVKTF